MSRPSLPFDSNTLDESETTGHRSTGRLEALRRTAIDQARAAGFWTAIALPFLYLPLLTGLDERTHAVVFLSLLVVNLVALLLGRHHSPE